jgi:hypothetical protein
MRQGVSLREGRDGRPATTAAARWQPFKQLHVPHEAGAPRVGRPPRRAGGRAGSGGSAVPAWGSGGPAAGGARRLGGGAPPPTARRLPPVLRFGAAGRTEDLQVVARFAAAFGRTTPSSSTPGSSRTARPRSSCSPRRHGDRRRALRPSAKSCQTIEVKEGDTEFFDLTSTARPIQYQLDVVRVFKKGAGTAVAAAAGAQRHSTAGADLLRRATRSAAPPSRVRGLPLAPESGRARPHAPARQGARVGQRRHRRHAGRCHRRSPGLPVWHWQLAG